MIELVDVGMHFESPGHEPRSLVENINHAMNPGELTVLFGRSGSGKSTLIKIAGGWLQPTTGEVKWDGTPVSDLSDDEKSRFRQINIGYLDQKVSLIDRLSALDNVLIPSINTPGTRNEALSQATGLLATLDLTVSARQRSSLLSGGERQRVGLARCLMMNPAVVLLDEPTSSLDLANARKVIDLLKQARERGSSVLAASHDPALVDIADTVLTLDQ